MKQSSKYGHGVMNIYARVCGQLSRTLVLFAFAAVCLNAAWAKAPSSPKSQKNVVFVSSPDLNGAKKTDRLMALENNKTNRQKFSEKTIKDRLKQEKDPMVRVRLNQALSSSDSSDAVVTLGETLRTDTDPMVRQSAAQSLSQYAKNSAAAKILADALSKETVPAVRYACALSLCLAESPEAMAALEKAAQDSDVLVRRQIAYGLHRNSGKEAKKILKKLAGDKDASVRETARQTPQ